MSNAVDNLFIKQWESEVNSQFTQTTSKLRDAVKVVTGVGSSFSFPRMESVTATLDKPRHAELVPAGVQSDRVEANIRRIHCSELLDNLDTVQTNSDLRKGYTDALVGAVNCQLDDLIITALNASTSTVVTMPTANTFNSAGMIALGKKMNGLDIPFEDRYCAISPGALDDILNDQKLVSRDYVTQQALQDGFVKGVLGFSLIHTTRLPVPSANQRRIFAWAKGGVGLAIAADLKVKIDPIPMRDAWLIAVSMAAGSVIIRPEAVQFADIAD